MKCAGKMCAGPGAPHGAWPLVAANFGTRGCRGPAHIAGVYDLFATRVELPPNLVGSD
jgi:hypothetical protein